MRVICVAGARPNFMKISPIVRALRAAGHTPVLVHTGQHYDLQMSGAFFQDLDLPAPDFDLEVGSGSHAQQTARVMERFEPIVVQVRPDWVIVVGDVNSTLACALVTAQLRPALGCRLAHVEAGLRSHDWTMPEELNRAVTDRVADLLLTPSADAEPNLAREGLDDRAVFVGNVMIDTLLHQLARAQALDVPGRLGLERGAYAVCTIHRPSNVDDPDALSVILTGLARISRELPVVLPIHPRTLKNAEAFGARELLASLRVSDPLGYREMLSLTDGAAVVLTDSGGLQEETTVLGVPCVTLRAQTERPSTITHGTNRLAPWPLTVDGIVDACRSAKAVGRRGLGERVPEGWDGQAAARVVAALDAAKGPK
ncbi:MAG TPA: UDP-N-acetylglucosamine 2-epimerase (non-hydrolyzing) [Vicinamibacterales bacterium]|nr:UDP-N-acetylglucosamine 2-epimerase (non-hydrolyzing) [Vicinamibacterales bacterium]